MITSNNLDKRAENNVIPYGDGKVFICDKISIRSGIEANSLVNSYIPPYSVAVGSPAVPIKCRFNKIKDLETVLTNTKSKYQIDHIIQAYKQFGITLS